MMFLAAVQQQFPGQAPKFSDESERTNYCILHSLSAIPNSITKFESFYTARRERLAKRLQQILVLSDEVEESGEDDLN